MIVVLWFLVLIAAIGTCLLANARTETAIARNIGLGAAAEALADAGVAQAAFNLTDPDEDKRWKLDGAEHRLKLALGEVRVKVADENAKINPNRASDALLTALFASAGVEEARARSLGAAVADWVSPDMAPRALGAKLEQYQQAGLRYGPPNAPIESLDELELVLGMTPEIFAAVRPYLSLHTSRDEPDPQNAPAIVQRTLVLAAREKRTVQSARASKAAERPAPMADDPDAPPAAAADDTQPAPAPPISFTATKSDMAVAAVEIIAKPIAGGLYVRHAVLRMDPANPKGYVVLDWRRGALAATD